MQEREPDSPLLAKEGPGEVRRFALALTVVFFAAGLFVLLRHEMWRDELEPWMVAKYSTSLGSLLWNMRYEGHPVLWYFLLYGLTRLWSTPEAMGYMHFLLAVGSVYLVARYAPLPRFWKALFAFGFYPFYQYAVISRGYALCVFLLFAFCALFPARGKRFVALSLILAALANADVYGWFYSLALAITLGAAWLSDKRDGAKWEVGRLSVAVGVFLIGFGVVISPLLSVPPPDCTQFSRWHFELSAQRLLVAIYGMTFTTNLLKESFYLPPNIIGLVILTLAFVRKRVIGVMWLSLYCLLFAFYYAKFAPLYWHKGMLFVYIIACAWLAAYFREQPLKWPGLDRLSERCRTLSGAVIAFMLVFFVLYGAKWVCDDIRKPYSSAKLAAEYIRSHSLQDRPIAGDCDFAVQSVSAYLDRPIYYPAGKRTGRYLIWDKGRKWPIPMGDLCAQVASLADRSNTDMLLILNYDLGRRDCAGHPAHLLREFAGSVKNDEDFRLYSVAAQRSGGR